MKNIITLLLLCFLSLSIKGQNQCKSPNEIEIDLNSIEINKCSIEEKTTNVIKSKPKQNKKTTPKAVFLRKRITNRFNKINKHQIVNTSINPLSTSIKSNKNLTLFSKEVLFVIADEIPLFPSCNNTSKKSNIKCFKSSINNHFKQYFDYERISEIEINNKILIQFTINIKGEIKNIQIHGANKNKVVIKEVHRVISRLPLFTSAKYKGVPVNVKYAFSINLTLS